VKPTGNVGTAHHSNAPSNQTNTTNRHNLFTTSFTTTENMGLIKTGLLVGAGVFAGKKLNERKHQKQQSQSSTPPPVQLPQQQQEKFPYYHSQTQSRSPGSADSYYNSYPQLEYPQHQRQPHEKPLQLNFVEPKKSSYSNTYTSEKAASRFALD
jgi:hypothetical protein